MLIDLQALARTLRRRTDCVTMDAAFRAFIMSRTAAGRANGTQTFYRQKLMPLIVHLAGQDVHTPADIKPEHLRTFMVSMMETHNTGGVHAFARAVRAFLRWLAEEELCDPRLPVRFKMPKAPKKSVHPFSPDEVQALIRATRLSALPERDAAIVLLLLDSGLRASELCGILLDDLGLDRVLVTGKGDKARWAPFSRITARTIKAYTRKRLLHDSPALFVSRTGEPLSTGALRQMLSRLGGLAGVENVHPHRWRHTFALEWLRDGGGTFELQDLLGHSSLAMTRHYVEMADDDLVRAHARHSPVERLRRR